MSNHSIRTIYNDGRYLGWPTLGRSENNGKLFAVFSGDRVGHVCPYGKVMMITSDDDGNSWSEAQTIADGPLDDRDAGVLITSDGTVLINWFTSVYFMAREGTKEKYTAESKKITGEIIGNELGCWMKSSTDNGMSFSEEKVPTIINTPHGPCELSDGSLLFVGVMIDDKETRLQSFNAPFSGRRLGVSRSFDNGKTWQMTSDSLPVADGQKISEYHEFHAIQAENGRIIAHIRNHNTDPFSIWQMESDDSGESWSIPHEIAIGGPSHLLKLQDGCLLMSYSHRNEPWSNLSRLSRDNGTTWDEPFVFGPTQPHTDMGYPSTVQLSNGELLSVWYERTKRHTAVLRMARWSLPSDMSHRD